MSKKDKKQDKPVRRTMIGGQALMEGVMMRGASAMALAVRAPDGEVVVETTRFKRKRPWYVRVPIVRGVVSFVNSLVLGVKTLLQSAEVSTPDEEMPGKFGMTVAVVVGVLIAVGLFILLPSFISWIFERFTPLGQMQAASKIIITSLIEGVLRIAIFVAYLLLVSKMNDIRRTFMYHGAEHRTINCFEKGLELNVANVQSCSTRHNRCGTTFLFFVMIISILVFSLVNWLFFSIGGIVADNPLIKMGIRLALLPFVAGLSFELLRGLAVLPDNWFVNILRAPGLGLQRLTTYPPEDEMAEVALKSFLAVYEMDNDESIPERKFGEVLMKDFRPFLAEELAKLGAEECETGWILCEALSVKLPELDKVKKLTKDQRTKAIEILEKRKAGQPLDYAIGHVDFFGLKIRTDARALAPRMETELLCERAVDYLNANFANKPARALDLCTGSGCIALCMAKRTNADVTAADIFDEALSLAKENLTGTTAKIVKSDMFSALENEKFDLIVSNPPYIATSVIDTLAVEVKAQPTVALDGGADGLDYYRIIAKEAPAHLNEGGALMLEIGFDQGMAVKELMQAAFEKVEVIKDYDANDRIVICENAKA